MLGQAADGDFFLINCLVYGAIIAATDPGSRYLFILFIIYLYKYEALVKFFIIVYFKDPHDLTAQTIS